MNEIILEHDMETVESNLEKADELEQYLKKTKLLS